MKWVAYPYNMFPIDTATSYQNPVPLNLWLYKMGENEAGSVILQSVPSTVIKTFENLGQEKRDSNRI